MTSFTPGPWIVSGNKIKWFTGYTVASINSHATTEGKANARLISAAPELLEALQGVQTMANCGQLDDFIGEPWLKAVAAAIKKATS